MSLLQVFVAAGLAKILKEHQWEGLRFLWESIYVNFKVRHMTVHVILDACQCQQILFNSEVPVAKFSICLHDLGVLDSIWLLLVGGRLQDMWWLCRCSNLIARTPSPRARSWVTAWAWVCPAHGCNCMTLTSHIAGHCEQLCFTKACLLKPAVLHGHWCMLRSMAV